MPKLFSAPANFLWPSWLSFRLSPPCSTTCTSIYINNLSNCQYFVYFFLCRPVSEDSCQGGCFLARQLGQFALSTVMEPRSVTQRLWQEIANEMNLLAHTAQINERDRGLERGPGVRGQSCPSARWPTGWLADWLTAQPDGEIRGAASSSTCVDILMTLTWHAVC